LPFGIFQVEDCEDQQYGWVETIAVLIGGSVVSLLHCEIVI
jgi:hypothetical protein